MYTEMMAIKANANAQPPQLHEVDVTGNNSQQPPQPQPQQGGSRTSTADAGPVYQSRPGGGGSQVGGRSALSQVTGFHDDFE